MMFNINDYKGKYAMHCKTKEEAETFCKYLHSIGKCWSNGKQYNAETRYDYYGEETAYAFNIGQYTYVDWYRKEGYTILEWSDFMKFTKSSLRTGDVVQRRNGNIEIVNHELGMLICKDGGWNDLDDIDEDLTMIGDEKEWDIIEVRRPMAKRDCCFNAMKYNRHYGTLVYERKEPEEMTLAEVCRLLGKEIKIVK